MCNLKRTNNNDDYKNTYILLLTTYARLAFTEDSISKVKASIHSLKISHKTEK